jgi:hypothetical protein
MSSERTDIQHHFQRVLRCLFLLVALAVGHAALEGADEGMGIPSCSNYDTDGCVEGQICDFMMGSVCRNMNDVEVPQHCKLESWGCTIADPGCAGAWVECNWVDDVH